ncbi:MAG TPA: hypothetical protein VF407_01415 [Polyangiaceae bacterium]
MSESTPPTQPTMKSYLSMLRVLWLALFVTPALFTFVSVNGKMKDGEGGPPPFALMAGIAAIVWVGSFVLPRILEKKTFAKLHFETTEEATAAEGGFRTSPEKVRVLVDPEGSLQLFLRHYQQVWIPGMALAEATSMCGLVEALGHRSWMLMLPFAAASWLSMLTKFPTREKILAVFDRVSGVKYRGKENAS